MKLSTRRDTELTQAALFTAITDFPRAERLLMRQGASVRRLDPAHEPGAGMAWIIAFDLRAKRRELRIDVTQFDRPETLSFSGVVDGIDIDIEVTVIALTRGSSRAIVKTDLKPRNMRARLLLQTAKLGKTQLNERYERRIDKYIGELTRTNR